RINVRHGPQTGRPGTAPWGHRPVGYRTTHRPVAPSATSASAAPVIDVATCRGAVTGRRTRCVDPRTAGPWPGQQASADADPEAWMPWPIAVTVTCRVRVGRGNFTRLV